MRTCPKCSKPVGDDIAKCPECGQLMPAKSTGTLDVGEHFDSNPESKEERPEKSIEPASTAKPARDDAKGTLGSPDFGSQVEETTEHTEGEPAVPDSDEQGTVNLSDSADGTEKSKTREYGEQQLDNAITGNGKSGTAGRLKRLW